jgi:hypothetical protein
VGLVCKSSVLPPVRDSLSPLDRNRMLFFSCGRLTSCHLCAISVPPPLKKAGVVPSPLAPCHHTVPSLSASFRSPPPSDVHTPPIVTVTLGSDPSSGARVIPAQEASFWLLPIVPSWLRLLTCPFCLPPWSVTVTHGCVPPSGARVIPAEEASGVLCQSRLDAPHPRPPPPPAPQAPPRPSR